MADWQLTGSRGEPWQVTMSRTGDGYVVHLIIADVMVILPALEAHKLGSALHAVSGLDASGGAAADRALERLRQMGEEAADAATPTYEERERAFRRLLHEAQLRTETLGDGDEFSAGGAGSASPDPPPNTGASGVASPDAPLVTKSGKVLTDAVLQGYADAAECAHDADMVEPFCPCPCHNGDTSEGGTDG